MRLVLASATPLPVVLRECFAGEDNALAGSALGLLAELVDDAPSLRALRALPALHASLQALSVRLAALQGDEREAMREEAELTTTLLDAWQPAA